MADDIEIPVGVYVGRVIRRWWIVLACALIAAVIALVAGRSDGKPVWSAKTLVSLGAPFSFNGGAITSSSGTNPNYVPAVIRQEAVVAAAATAAGLMPSQLRGHISSQPTGQPSKLGYTPLVTITVQGPWSKAVTQAAADAVAACACAEAEVDAIIDRATKMADAGTTRLILCFMRKSPWFLFRCRNVPAGSGGNPTRTFSNYVPKQLLFGPFGLFENNVSTEFTPNLFNAILVDEKLYPHSAVWFRAQSVPAVAVDGLQRWHE